MKDTNSDVRVIAVKEFSKICNDDKEVFQFLESMAKTDNDGDVIATAIEELSRSGLNSDRVLKFIRERVDYQSKPIRAVAIKEIARLCPDDNTLRDIKQKIFTDNSKYVRRTAFEALVKAWPNDPETFEFIKKKVMNDKNSHNDMQIFGIKALISFSTIDLKQLRS
jgi:CO/xanthine dehydrogenase FAD-binding subunit